MACRNLKQVQQVSISRSDPGRFLNGVEWGFFGVLFFSLEHLRGCPLAPKKKLPRLNQVLWLPATTNTGL